MLADLRDPDSLAPKTVRRFTLRFSSQIRPQVVTVAVQS
jgi:hypothetical protein